MSRVASSFGQAARTYDACAELQRRVAQWLFEGVRAELACSSVKQVVDLGCGTGYCTEWLSHFFRSANLIALDIAPEMVAFTAGRVPSAKAFLARAEELPLPTESVDLLVSSLAMQWAEDPGLWFSEINRVLSPGGMALLTTFGPASLLELKHAWAKVDGRKNVNTFFSMHFLEDSLKKLDFSYNIEADMFSENYRDLLSLSNNLRNIGASTVTQTSKKQGLTTPAQFGLASHAFGKNTKVHWEVYRLCLRKNATD